MDRCSAELDIPKVCLTLSFRALGRLEFVVAHCLDKEASRNASCAFAVWGVRHVNSRAQVYVE